MNNIMQEISNLNTRLDETREQVSVLVKHPPSPNSLKKLTKIAEDMQNVNANKILLLRLLMFVTDYDLPESPDEWSDDIKVLWKMSVDI